MNQANMISEGVLKLERVQVICPACGQQVEAVASDGWVKGYCAVAKQFVDFPIETQRVQGRHFTAESKAKQSSLLKKRWQDPEYRAKMNAAAKKYWQDPENRAKQSAAHTGKPLTVETRAKISAALKGKRKPLTAEHRAKLSAAQRGKRKLGMMMGTQSGLVAGSGYR